MSRRGTLLLVLAILAAGVVPPPSAGAATPKVSLAEIELEVMCVSCHEPLALAQSPQAASEKAYVKQLVDRGLSKAQIEDALVAQYGVAVLGKPPAHGFNLTVYVLPPAVLLAGAAILLYTLPRWRERSRRAATTPMLEGPELDPAAARRLQEDLARFD